MEIIKKKQENKGPLTDCSVLAAALVSVRRKIFIHKVDTIIDYTERFKFTFMVNIIHLLYHLSVYGKDNINSLIIEIYVCITDCIDSGSLRKCEQGELLL